MRRYYLQSSLPWREIVRERENKGFTLSYPLPSRERDFYV